MKREAIATRYSGGPASGKRGDGKVGIIGELVIVDPKTNRVKGFLEISTKGIYTGLFPVGETPDSNHGSGKSMFNEVFMDVLMSEYLRANGNSATGTLAR